MESEGDTFRRNRRDLIRLPDSETGANHSEPDEPVQSAHSNDSNNSHDDTRTTDSIAQPTVHRSTRNSRPPDRAGLTELNYVCLVVVQVHAKRGDVVVSIRNVLRMCAS